MRKLGSLSAYPASTLHAARSAVAALLRYGDMLPTDLSIKLDLFYGDISEALRSTRPPNPVFIPRPTIRSEPTSNHGAPTSGQVPPSPSVARANPPERH